MLGFDRKPDNLKRGSDELELVEGVDGLGFPEISIFKDNVVL